ncbi:MAG: polysaccharide biosynthesis/export family protein [Planctomycetia bacterium]|nr:polysaccharide biosynthesis/export family protein [Planctomycetia bacterium]
MDGTHRRIHVWHRSASALVLFLLAGCHVAPFGPQVTDSGIYPPNSMPRELAKVALPAYVIEPPDVIRVDTVHAVPRSPYSLRTLDAVSIQVIGTLPSAPIAGTYPIEPGGVVNLGSPYGAVMIAGLTVEQAQVAIAQHLQMYLRTPDVSVALVELGASQQLGGEYIVAPDGTITLGSYGPVSVVGQTVAQATRTVEHHLARFLEAPVVSLEVFAYNSKAYYIVVQGAGFGDSVYRMPITGNETVLDAISQINGLERVSSKQMWVARPSHEPHLVQVLPVDWCAITQAADTSTNYQMLPGDRLFVAEDKLISLDTQLAKVLAPVERVMGFSLLTIGTATRFSGPVLRGGGNPNGRF